MGAFADSIVFLENLPLAPPGYGIVLVNIGGTGTLEEPPEFEIVIDGVPFGHFSVPEPAAKSSDVVYTPFVFFVEPAHPSRVDIFFHDDGKSGEIDRNLFVDYIEVNGDRVESEVSGFYTRVTGTVIGPTENILWNGTLTFDDLPQSGWSRVMLTVAGTGADDAPPRFEVFFDGVSAGTFAVSDPAATSASKVYENVILDVDHRPETVEIVYLNDGRSGTIDRNLYVDAISVDGDRYEAETDGSYTRWNGIEIGATTNMYWNGSMTFQTAAPDTTTVLLRMAGLGEEAAPPIFDVRIDGVSMGIQAITEPRATSAEKVFDYFVFEVEGSEVELVEIEYLKSSIPSDIDGVIYIDYIEVGAERYESETDSHYVTSKGVDKGASGDMYWYGTCSFDLVG